MACAVKGIDGRMPCFEVILSTDTTRSCAQLRGELDLTTAPRLERLLDELYRDGSRQIILDMSGLEFLGASALSVFVRVDQALRAAGGELVLTRPSRMASRILSITGLDATLTIQ
jgi:stage II sporulation protein AA (anti-sigma F factor antagonist)